MEGSNRHPNALQQCCCGEFLELKADALIYRVIQTAGGAHDRWRSVAQTVHLVQATRLISARHQENICASLDFVGYRLIEFELHRDVRGKLPRRRAIQVLDISPA